MVIYSSLHKGLPCSVVISGGREDDIPKKPVDFFVLQLHSLVFSISGSNCSGVSIHEDLGIQTINNTVSPTTTPIR